MAAPFRRGPTPRRRFCAKNKPIVTRTRLVIAIPTVFLGPVLLLVLTGIATMTEALVRICINLLKAVLAIVAIIVILAALAASHRSHRNRKPEGLKL